MSLPFKEWEDLSKLTGNILRPGGLEITKHALSNCNFKKGYYLLDLGCGLGGTISYLSSIGYNTLGIDISAELLKKAKIHTAISRDASAIKRADVEPPAIMVKSVSEIKQVSEIKSEILIKSATVAKQVSEIKSATVAKQAFEIKSATEIKQVSEIKSPTFIQANIQNIPLKDASLHGIFCECVLSLLENKDCIIQELYRILHKGGKLIISDIVRKNSEHDLIINNNLEPKNKRAKAKAFYDNAKPINNLYTANNDNDIANVSYNNAISINDIKISCIDATKPINDQKISWNKDIKLINDVKVLSIDAAMPTKDLKTASKMNTKHINDIKISCIDATKPANDQKTSCIDATRPISDQKTSCIEGAVSLNQLKNILYKMGFKIILEKDYSRALAELAAMLVLHDLSLKDYFLQGETGCSCKKNSDLGYFLLIAEKI